MKHLIFSMLIFCAGFTATGQRWCPIYVDSVAGASSPYTMWFHTIHPEGIYSGGNFSVDDTLYTDQIDHLGKFYISSLASNVSSDGIYGVITVEADNKPDQHAYGVICEPNVSAIQTEVLPHRFNEKIDNYFNGRNRLREKLQNLYGKLELPQISDGGYFEGDVMQMGPFNEWIGGQVGNVSIADGAIGTDELQDASISSAKIQTGAVRPDQIDDEAVTAEKLANNAVTAEKLSPASTNGFYRNHGGSLDIRPIENLKADLAISYQTIRQDGVDKPTATALNFVSSSTVAPTVTDDPGTPETEVQMNIPNDGVTYAKLQNVSATSRFLGRITSGAGDIEELTGTQATTLLDNVTSSLKGLAPASGGGTTNFLRADGTWAAPAGGGSPNGNAGAVQFKSPTSNNFRGLDVVLIDSATQKLTITGDASTTNAAVDKIVLSQNSTGTPVAGLGPAIKFQGESSTTTNRDMASINSVWSNVTDASRSAKLTFNTVQSGTMAERAVILAGGDFGIGTTAPAYKLDVQGGQARIGFSSTVYTPNPVAGLSVQRNDTYNYIEVQNNTSAAVYGSNITYAATIGGHGNGGIMLNTATGKSPGSVYSRLWVKDDGGQTGMYLGGSTSSNGTITYLPGTIFSQTASSTAITNTTSETSLLGTGVGTTTLAAATFRAGTRLHVVASGTIATDAVTPGTLNVKLKLGSTVVTSTTATTLVAVTGTKKWKADFYVTCRTSGASGVVQAGGDFQYYSAAGVLQSWSCDETNTTSFSTTGTLAVDVTATFGTADTDNSMQSTQALVTIEGAN